MLAVVACTDGRAVQDHEADDARHVQGQEQVVRLRRCSGVGDGSGARTGDVCWLNCCEGDVLGSLEYMLGISNGEEEAAAGRVLRASEGTMVSAGSGEGVCRGGCLAVFGWSRRCRVTGLTRRGCPLSLFFSILPLSLILALASLPRDRPLLTRLSSLLHSLHVALTMYSTLVSVALFSALAIQGALAEFTVSTPAEISTVSLSLSPSEPFTREAAP